MTTPPATMQWTSASSTAQSLDDAVTEAADRLLRALHGREPDLVLAFVSPQHQAHFAALPSLLRREFERATLFGSSGDGVIGDGTEYENHAALTLCAAALPEVRIHAVALQDATVPPLYAERSLWSAALQLQDSQPACMLLCCEPFGFDVETFLKGLDRHYPGIPKLGGVAGGIEQAGQPCLLLNDHVYSSGMVCLTLSGDIHIDTIVAQGCRPIGEPMFANNTHDNLLLELDGKIPRDVLTELYSSLRRKEREFFTDALFLGIAMEKEREQYHAGDFLIRSILGLDPDSGALWVNSPVATNSVVQLHLRDAQTSVHELDRALQSYQSSGHAVAAKACLMFACTQRGTGFYGHADHDSNAIRQALATVPIAGFFCNGEIGPVNGRTYLHGYTSVIGIIRSKQ